MVSVKKRTDDRPKPWLVRWRDEAGTDRKRAFKRKVDADRFRAEVEHTLNTGTYIDPAAGKVTFRAYAEQWRAIQVHRPNTAARVKSGLFKHAYPAMGSRPINQVRTSEIQAFVTSVPLAPSSVRPLFGTVRAIFGAALRDRAIGRDPCIGIKMPELPRDLVVPLTLEQVDGLAAVVPARVRGLVDFDAGSGLRQGEVFGIEVEAIDLEAGVVKVYQQVQPAVGGGIMICPPKGKHSYRDVPIGHTVVEGVRRHLADFPPVAVQVLDTTGPKPVTRAARFVFAAEGGHGYVRSAFNADIWGPARKAVGLPESGMHDLRHFYASALIRAGLSPKVVAARLGHADASMTLRVYTHLWPDDEDRSRQAIDDLFSKRCAPDAPQPEGVISPDAGQAADDV